MLRRKNINTITRRFTINKGSTPNPNQQTNQKKSKNKNNNILHPPPPRLIIINFIIKNITKKRRRKKRRTEGGRTAILSVKQLTAHSSKKNTTGTVLKGRKEGRKEG